MAQFTVNAHALRPVQELQVPREVGRPLRRRRPQGRRAEAHAPRWSSTARAATRRRSRKSPGRTKYEAITLERGVTHDTEFEKWANKVWNFGSGLGAEVSLKDFRKDIIIEVYNEAGQLALAYKVYRCWVSEYQALPDLDANANAVAIQHIKLENEGWERDYDVAEPTEPSFTEPALSRSRCARSSAAICSRCGSAARARHPLDRALLLCALGAARAAAPTRSPTCRSARQRERCSGLRAATLRRRASRRYVDCAALRRAARARRCDARRCCAPRAATRRRAASRRSRGLRFRAPCTARPGRGRATSATPSDAALRLLARCCVRRRRPTRRRCLGRCSHEVEDALEALDPTADLALDAALRGLRPRVGGAARRRRAAVGRDRRARARAARRGAPARARLRLERGARSSRSSAARRAAYLAMVGA